MNHRKLLTLAAAPLAVLAIAAPVYASSGETSLTGRLLGATAINSRTCRFAFPERDPATGPTWQNLRAYVIYEDARSDVKMACLARHMGQRGARGARGWTGPAGPAGPAGGVSGYVRVSAPIDFKQATASASCPTGDVALGGGATVEVAGSYPSSDGAWTVTRDSMWGHLKAGTVYAICAKAAS